MGSCGVCIRGVLALVILASLGCAAAHQPLTRQMLSTGLNFEQVPSGLEEFDTYAVSPHSKAFAVAAHADGTVHAWAKA